MSYLRKLAHLEEQLGPAYWAALLDPKNTGKVREFIDEKLIVIPAKITVGGRTYEVLPLLKEGQVRLFAEEAVARTREMGAYLGQEELNHLLSHCGEIPGEFKHKMFLFTGVLFSEHCREERVHHGGPDDLACVRHYEGKWIRSWYRRFERDCYLLRPKP